MDTDELLIKMTSSPLKGINGLNSIPMASGVYTAWLHGESRCFYVGRAKKSLLKRIKDHFSGSRGGDQFCLYVYDRYIHQRRPAGLKTREVNRLTKVWIRENIKFKYVEVQESEAKELEREMRRKWKPILNPL